MNKRVVLKIIERSEMLLLRENKNGEEDSYIDL